MSGTFKLLLIIFIIWVGGRLIYNIINTDEPSDPISVEELDNMLDKFEEDSKTLLDNSEN